MILRVPDYYEDFSCKAGDCADSCCIGWEIDIDEDTEAYYRSLEGPLGDKLRQHLYVTEEGDSSFRLQRKGRCPFLDGRNLCEICSELGEEALSYVCTEYPRFSIEYGNVLQKCLSLSCEEVGNLLFHREEPVRILDLDLDWGEEEDSPSHPLCSFLSEAQEQLLAILQDRSRPLQDRVAFYLSYAAGVQEILNAYEREEDASLLTLPLAGKCIESAGNPAWPEFLARRDTLNSMEVLDGEWEGQKKLLDSVKEEKQYQDLLDAYRESVAYVEQDYEQLLVYFTFRYFMNSVYNGGALSYAKLAVCFTRMVRDLDLLRFEANGGAFSRVDRIDICRIFSKEVEHSEENVELAREALMFE